MRSATPAERPPVTGPRAVVGRLADLIAAGARRVAMLATLLMAALIVVEVGGRGLLRTSTLVADEMAGYLLVVLASFGLADSFASGSFIRVTLLGDRLPRPVRRRLESLLLVAALAYTAFLAYHLWSFTVSSYVEQTRSVDFSRTPLWIPRAFMAAGVSALALQILAVLAGPAAVAGRER